MTSYKEHFKINQFDGTNFGNWKYRLGILLDGKGLKKYINGKLEDLLSSALAGARDKMKQEEKDCKAVIVESIHDSQLEYVKDCEFAKDMIDNLEKVFERKTIAGQLFLRKQLLTMKYNEADDINQHFLIFDKTVRELKAIGATIERLDIVCHLLLTLPKSYNTLVTTLESMNPDNLTLEFVKSRLMDEFSKRSGGKAPVGKSDESHAMSSSIVCYKCGKPGHIKPKCRSRGFNKTNKGNNGSNKKTESAHNTSDETKRGAATM